MAGEEARRQLHKSKTWRQHPTRHQLYGHLPPIRKTIRFRRTRHARHCWRSRHELISDVLLWTTHIAWQKLDKQLEHTFNSSARIRDVALKTYQRRWTIGKSGERGSGISVLAAQHHCDGDPIYPTPPLGQDITQGQFLKRSLAVLNSEFSFS